MNFFVTSAEYHHIQQSDRADRLSLKVVSFLTLIGSTLASGSSSAEITNCMRSRCGAFASFCHLPNERTTLLWHLNQSIEIGEINII